MTAPASTQRPTTSRTSPGSGAPAASRPSSGPRTAAWLVGAAVVLVVSVSVAVTLGPAHLPVSDVWRSVAQHLGLDGPLGLERLAPLPDGLVWELRLPRVLTAAGVGAGLAVCGVVMQSLTRNPLADPYLLGLSSGASLGAVCVLGLGVALVLPVAAFAGALLALLATLGLAGAAGGLTPSRTVLAGLAVSQLAAAGVSFVIFWTSTGDSYQDILSWLLGSVAGATWTSVAVTCGATLVLGGVLAATGSLLDAFTFGDTAAAALGVPVERARRILLVLVAVLTGALVSQSGSIGFVGLVLPHAVRLVVGTRNRLLLPLSGLLGASSLVWADTAARTVFAPREIPVGVMTAAVGAPVFAFLLWRGRGRA